MAAAQQQLDFNAYTSSVRLTTRGFALVFTGNEPELEQQVEVTVRFQDPAWLNALALNLTEAAAMLRNQAVRVEHESTSLLATIC